MKILKTLVAAKRTKKQSFMWHCKALNTEAAGRTLACYPKLCLLNTLHIHMYRDVEDHTVSLLYCMLVYYLLSILLCEFSYP